MGVKQALFLILLLLFMTGCAALQSQGGSSGNEPQEFENTKEMVTDVLKTEDGKAALEEVLTDEDMQASILMEQDFVQDTVQTTLTSENGQQYFQEVMQQPDFQENVAKSMQQENEAILKRLMKDPEYQQMMMEVMQDPEMQQEHVKLLKSKTFREEMQTAIEEAFDNPNFQQQLSDLMEQQQQEGSDSQESNGGGDNQEDSDQEEDGSSGGSGGEGG
ncbi:spore germination lipoprotein GerD [Salicibibacter cibarius]|uniref:spore germination lipoprotein GerD n=1 Tax=Salicibibacter cibarius TaxID=2743000 RepID=UPI001B7D7D0B|nr:spore germination lipoprotein GerD [Salicibibacter cibarius]